MSMSWSGPESRLPGYCKPAPLVHARS